MIHAAETSLSHKETLGQYFTPYTIANFMSSLFPITDKKIRLFAPDAGIRTRSCSFIERIIREQWQVPDIHISLYDIDKNIYSTLNESIALISTALKK